MSWPNRELKEVARVVGGATPKSGEAAFWDGDVAWATPKDLADLDGKEITDTPRKITSLGLRSCSAERLPVGSVLFSSRAPIGHIAINTVPMATNQGFKSFIPGPELDASFLYWWLDANRERLQAMGNGATFKEVSKAVVERIVVPVPPLPQQKRIATILDQADVIRRLSRRYASCLSGLRSAIFREMFSSAHTASGLTPIGEIIRVSSGSALTAKAQRGGAYPVYGGNGINGWHDAYNVPAETIVLGRVGVYCGAVHTTKQNSWVTDNALVVTKKREISTVYLADALHFANLNQYAGRSAQPLISGSRIYPVEILVPDEAAQAEYQTRISNVARQVNLATASKETTETLFASLQHRAFKGNL